jgi:disulfide bond formation protein DsbB
MKSYFLYLAWLIALISTLTTIYYGEIKGLEPCSMCWYQRICMFPLSIILGIAAYRQDYQIRKYIFPLIIIGFLLGLWQFLEHKIPALTPPTLCGWEGDCKNQEYQILGASIPLLSAVAFLSMFILLCFKPDVN